MEYYVVREGDPTTTGGKVVFSAASTTLYGPPVARVGDLVTCPRCKTVGYIAEGHDSFTVGGLAVASEGHVVQCGCPLGSNRLLATQSRMSVEESLTAIAPQHAAQAQEASRSWTQAMNAGDYQGDLIRELPPQRFAGATSASKTPTATPTEAAEPGFHIVQNPMPRAELEALLFPQPNAAVLAKFRTLNPHLSSFAKPGQMVVLSDPQNFQCTREESLLMEAAKRVNNALEPLSDDESTFMARHHDEIEHFLSEGATAIGIGEVMFSKHLDNLKLTLTELEALHQRIFQQHGKLQTSEFFAHRKLLMSQLDNSLGPLVRKGVGIPDHPKLKNALGISSRSLVHHWSKAGAPGSIPGYSTHIDGVAKASKYINAGGWIGIGLGASASVLKVQEACEVGREKDCQKVKFTESGKFTGGLAGGAIAGALVSGAASTTLCAAIGAGTFVVGGIICGLVVVGGASLAGGKIGEAVGETYGEQLYLMSQ